MIAIVALTLQLLPRASIDSHLSEHLAYIKNDFLTEKNHADLLGLIYEMKEFPSNVDNKGTGFIPKYPHVGEATPTNKDGSCSHPYLIPNYDKTLCILPERIDVGKHFIMTGGLDGNKEAVGDLINRVSSFGKYTFFKDIDKFPIVKSLFESDNFQAAAKSVCPKNATALDPFQFNFIFQVPGQTVAMHLDAPYFWGASRFHFPQWLLAVMMFSNLFQDRFIDQIQVVGYLHNWDPSLQANGGGGQFVYYTNETNIGIVTPQPRAGVIVDGSKTLHAAKIYRPDVKAPALDKNKQSSLVYIDGNDWELQVDGTAIRKYKTEDLRISIVYRARCFASPEQAQQYTENLDTDMLPLETILQTLRDDLVARGITTKAKLDTMNPLDFAELLLGSYIKYPLPPKELAFVPYNYCALPLVLPWTQPFFDLIC